MNRLLEAALNYRRQGFSVIPIRPNDKRPLVAWEPFKNELASEEEIHRRWKKHPNANVGIVTGAISGLVVIDLDSEEAKTKLTELLNDYDLSTVPTSHTGKGWHLFFKYPPVKIASRTGVISGLDVRADGGYVVAPPSVHFTGNIYTWTVEPTGELPDLPQKLLDLIQSDNNENGLSIRDPINMSRVLAGVPKGERNDTLFRAACKLRGAGVPLEYAKKLITEAADSCDPPYDERDPIEIARHAYDTYPPESEKSTGQNENPWEKATPAPFFLDQEEEQFVGIVKDILAPGVITIISAPRGLGKTHIAHALAVALATGGTFRGEQMSPTRVLLVDRDNPPFVIRDRLNCWGAKQTEHLRVLTRKDSPSLKDRKAWEKFPTEQYQVVIIDSLGSFTEGITEKEGKATTEVLATLLDLARKNLAVLILHNTTKDDSSMRGRGELADRFDIVYEVRDATGFVPSGKKPWWEELPEGGSTKYANRATRRKGRTDYRLAFIPSKFRLAQEPEPFCLQLDLPKQGAWTLTDVTHELVASGDTAREQARKEKEEQLERAAAVLKASIVKRAGTGNLLLKSEAEKLLLNEKLTQAEARELIEQKTGIVWLQEKQPGGRGKGKPIALLLCENEHPFISTTKKQSNKVKIYFVVRIEKLIRLHRVKLI